MNIDDELFGEHEDDSKVVELSKKRVAAYIKQVDKYKESKLLFDAYPSHDDLFLPSGKLRKTPKKQPKLKEPPRLPIFPEPKLPAISKRAERIMNSFQSHKDGTSKKKNKPDMIKLWYNINHQARQVVELRISKMPIARLNDVSDRDPETAKNYACRDADGTGRLFLYDEEMFAK